MLASKLLGCTAKGFPTYVSSTGIALGTNASSIALTLPSGLSDGDLMVAVVGHGNTSTWTAPAGWTKALETNAPDSEGLLIAYKVASSESGSQTFTADAGTNRSIAGGIIAIRGASALQVGAVQSYATAATSHVAPSLTATDDGLVMSVFLNGLSAPTVSSNPALATTTNVNDLSPSGSSDFSLHATRDVDPTLALASTGTRTVVWSASTRGIAVNALAY